MKKTMLAAALCAMSLSVFAGGIALLQNRNGKHRDEFDAAFAELGWEPTRYVDTVESMKELFEVIGRYDLLLVSPLFNYDVDLTGKIDMGPVREYVERGGMLVITDASYEGVRKLFDPVAGDIAKIKTGKCTSSQWSVLGHTRNVEPVHPLRSFPNAATDPDSWPHFLADGKSPWQTITVCSEGNPVILYREIGKGCAVVSAIRQTSPKCIANYFAYSRLRKSGLTAKSFAMSPLRPGKGSLSVELAHEAPKGTSVVLSIENEKKKTATFSTNIVGRAVSLGFDVPFRGPIRVALAVDAPAGKSVIFSRRAVMPRLMEVGPNAYRGLLSTKRRLDDVKFPVSLEPDTEDLGLARLGLAVFDSSSNQVASLETVLPSNDVPRKIWVPVPLSKKLAAGGYRIDALLTKPRAGKQGAIRAESSAAFEIIEPRVAQTVVDEDGTFLVNGRPFFPLGIYHTNPDKYAEISELGFNAQQFWKWHVGGDGYGAPLGLDKAAANKLKCLFESNHLGRHIYKDCAERFGNHSAIFMWYVADEPAEGSEAFMAMANGTWHEFDKHHPTYVASCRPDLFAHHAKYADVFGFDPYSSYRALVDWCRLAEEEIAPHQATICVPWADQKDLRMIRAQAYTAICHNVRGLIWYCWNQAGGGPLGVGIHDKAAAKAEFKAVLAELNEMLPSLTLTTRRTFEEGDVHAIVLGGKGDWRKRYLVMVNTSDQEVKADFEVPELKGAKGTTAPFLPGVEKKDAEGRVVKDRKGNPVMAERPFELTGGRVVHAFKPYGTFVIHW